MKRIFSILAIMLLVPSLAFALSLTVSATTTSGTVLGDQQVLKCKGYLFDANPNLNPWDTANCQQLGVISTLDFGTLSTVLQKTDGTDSKTGAGCFYARDFFIVYLYPDAWGGKGYELKQAGASFDGPIANSVIMTPVYSPDDKYSATGTSQGIMDAAYGETPQSSVLARIGGTIFKSKRGRIVRAQYSIPPNKADGLPWVTGWVAVDKSTPAAKYGSSSMSISITEWQ